MRVLIVDTYYPRFLHTHYARQPGLSSEGYDTQWRALMDAMFGTADAYSHNLAKLGHEAHEIVVNCSPLQAAWAREHDADDGDAEALLLAQARAFDPDVVLVQHVHYLSDETLDRLRRMAGLLVGHLATEPPPTARLRRFDLLLTPLPSFVERFSAEGVHTELLHLAFDERALERVGEDDGHVEHDAVFVGSLGRTQHRRANGIVARAAWRAPIEFWGYGGRLWPPWSPVKRRYRGEAWGVDMYRLLHRSRLVVNRHGAIAGPYAANMRLFEATGMGCLLVTDAKRNLAELFEADREVVTYRSARELRRRISHYLAHEEERAAIARAGQRRTLAEHTYARRMERVADLLRGHLG